MISGEEIDIRFALSRDIQQIALSSVQKEFADEHSILGLKAPEFIQESNFRAILWSKNDPSSDENASTSGENALSSIVWLK